VTDDRSPNEGARIRRTDPSRWPPGIRVIGQNKLDNLGIDDAGQLYWEGRPVVTRRRFDLTYWQEFGVVVGVSSGAISTLVALAEFILDRVM